jgi:pheromone a factor receptor
VFVSANTTSLTRLDFIVQGHRYNVFEDLGPMVATYNVTVAFPLYYIWEPLVCFISAIYCALTLGHFMKKRAELNKMFEDQSTRVTKSRYTRLLGLCVWSIVVHLPVSCTFIFICAILIPISPWISWEDTQSNWSRIRYFNRIIMDSDAFHVNRIQITLAFCFVPFSAFAILPF